MKLLSLSLSAVGPFTGIVLDLSAGKEGLHLIYGPNEAGKTSALRAVSHLLFGFPHLLGRQLRPPQRSASRGGKLRHSGGDELEVIRRRGNKNTLRGPDDSSVIADRPVEAVPGGHEPGDLRDPVRYQSRAADPRRRGNSQGSRGNWESCSSPRGPGWLACAWRRKRYSRGWTSYSDRGLKTRGSTRFWLQSTRIQKKLKRAAIAQRKLA